MKIAVACDGLEAASHAARCESFMCYTIDKGIVSDCRNLPNMGITSQEGAKLVRDLGFNVLITGGIDIEMATELCDAGVEVVAGASGLARDVMNSWLSDTLMGAVSFCENSLSCDDECDIDNEFDRLEQIMRESVHTAS